MRLGSKGNLSLSVGLSLTNRHSSGGGSVAPSGVFFDYVVGDTGVGVDTISMGPSNFDGTNLIWTADGVEFDPSGELQNFPEGVRIVGVSTEALSKFNMDSFDIGGTWIMPNVAGVFYLNGSEFTELTGSFGTLSSTITNIVISYDGLIGSLSPLPTSLETFDITAVTTFTDTLIPDLTNCTNLTSFQATIMPYTGLSTEFMPLGVENFVLYDCPLTQESMEVILGTFGVDIENRPEAVYIELDGPSTADASATALALRSALISQKPSWEIVFNGD